MKGPKGTFHSKASLFLECLLKSLNKFEYPDIILESLSLKIGNHASPETISFLYDVCLKRINGASILTVSKTLSKMRNGVLTRNSDFITGLLNY